MLTTTTIAYKTLGGGRYLAMINGDKITHVPDGDWSRAFTSDRIDYVTSNGDRYVAKFENGQFLHAPDGDFSQAHQSKHLDYQDWEGKSYFATLDRDTFTFEQSAPKNIPTTKIIAYKTIWGGNYLAMISGDEITHVPDGDWSRAFTSDRIDYVTSNGDRYVAKLENDQFLHAPDGDFSRAHQSKHLDFQSWGGKGHFVTLDQGLFTSKQQSIPENFANSQPPSDDSTNVIKGKWEISEPQTISKWEISEPQIISIREIFIKKGPNYKEPGPLKVYEDPITGKLSTTPPQHTGEIRINRYHTIRGVLPHSPQGSSSPNTQRRITSTLRSPFPHSTNNPRPKPKPITPGVTLEPLGSKRHLSHAIYGTEGNDRIYGSDVHDHIEGGHGDDFISGRAGGDYITGGSGDDRIFVGERDTITGGIGRDTFVFFQPPSTGNITITDFGVDDTIEIFSHSFNVVFGHIADLQDGVTSPVNETVNLGSSSGFRYLSNSGQLFYDADGGDFSSGGHLMATLRNKPTIETLNSRISVLSAISI